ncbi:MAG TPA: metallophosphoesterase [Candidatus Latescibacteria bacterium]|nr:metallophosphoesterase [Candidatus Latescibacterota bacterium]
MRYALIADLHGNLEALRVVLHHIDREQPDRLVCLGDLVGYGADPEECIDIVRDRTDRVVVGNHDWAAIGKADISYFNPYAWAAVLWTQGRLRDFHRRYLERLPLTLQEGELYFVHSTPERPEEWNYIFSRAQAAYYLSQLPHRICFIGHSHVPAAFVLRGNDVVLVPGPSLRIPIEPGLRYLINVGSAGQPRDGDNRASYAVVDLAEQVVEVKRVPYDIPTAQRKILKAGLPEVLAERLAYGQ